MQPTRFLPARALKDRLTGWSAVMMLPALLWAGEPAHAELVARASWSDVEQEILTEHNRLRQNPQSYVPILQAYLARMDAQGNIPNGCGSNCTLLTQEGQAAVEEAIRFLQNQAPTGALAYSAEAAQAAQAHAQDQRDGAIGHRGSDGSSPSQRLSQFGVESHASGENIAYGPETAQTVLMNLLIDDGVADRGHRTNLFSPEWTMAGVGCGPHATIRTVCVIDYVKAPQTTASNSQLSIVNNGTVELLALKVASLDILGGPLAPGESRKILLNNEQACDVTLNIYMGGNYQPLDWEGLNICNAQMTMDSKNSFTLRY